MLTWDWVVGEDCAAASTWEAIFVCVAPMAWSVDQQGLWLPYRCGSGKLVVRAIDGVERAAKRGLGLPVIARELRNAAGLGMVLAE